MQVGFLNNDAEDETQENFDYRLDFELDVCPFFKQDADVYQLQAVITVEEGILGVMSFATYIKNSKGEWLKINMYKHFMQI